MVKIRLTLRGRKNAPSYRIVVADSKKARDSKYIEDLGYFNPTNNPPLFKFNKERYEYWLGVGAKPTQAVTELVNGKYKFVKYDAKAIAEAKQAEKEKQENDAKEAEQKEAPQSEEAKEEDKDEPAKDGGEDKKEEVTKEDKDEPKEEKSETEQTKEEQKDTK